MFVECIEGLLFQFLVGKRKRDGNRHPFETSIILAVMTLPYGEYSNRKCSAYFPIVTSLSSFSRTTDFPLICSPLTRVPIFVLRSVRIRREVLRGFRWSCISNREHVARSVTHTCFQWEWFNFNGEVFPRNGLVVHEPPVLCQNQLGTS